MTDLEADNTTPSPSAWGAPRSKTIDWHDPIVAARSLIRMSGLEALEAIRDGRAAPPPIASLFGFDITSVAAGEVVFTCSPDESAYNPIGMVHGGLVCTLLDTVIGCAVHSTLPAGVAYTSIELKVNYLRPVHAGNGHITARGWTTKPGRRVAFAEGEVRDDAGKLLATASGSCLVMS